MLTLIGRLFEELNARGIRYCHWKSNMGLDGALQGIGDLDLLVDPMDWPTFEAVLKELGFVKAAPSSWQTSAETHHHYFGMDGPTGRLAHVDACDRVVTGGTLLKNHDLPLRDMIFESLSYAGIVPVPGRAQELVALVLRKTIESASPLEHAYLLRELREVRAELRALADGETRLKAPELVARWLPRLEPSLFERCLAALASGSLVQRWLVGCQLARTLRPYQLRGSSAAEAFRAFAFARRLLARLGWGEQGVAVSSRGALVAFIGPEGSGKSTLVAETGRWLAQALRVRAIHAGKPPASFITAFTRPFVPLLRAVAPRYRTTMFDVKRSPTSESKRGLGFYLYALRCVALAYDRAKLLRTAERKRGRGAIVLCDRYPLHGTLPDGVQLDERKLARQGNRRGRAMARMERALYSQVPTPDTVIACQVSLELALQRNLTRSKRGGPEPESLVRLRHSQFSNASLELEAYRVHTDRPLPETLSTVRRVVWDCIARNQNASPLPHASQDVARSIPIVKGPM